jgi:hypothetical protein
VLEWYVFKEPTVSPLNVSHKETWRPKKKKFIFTQTFTENLKKQMDADSIIVTAACYKNMFMTNPSSKSWISDMEHINFLCDNSTDCYHDAQVTVGTHKTELFSMHLVSSSLYRK